MVQQDELLHIDSNDILVYQPDVKRAQEVLRISNGLKTSCSSIEVRTGRQNKWNFSPELVASSIVRWRSLGNQSRELSYLDTFVENLINPLLIASYSAPMNFDLFVRVTQELYRTYATEDWGLLEEDLLKSLAEKRISPQEYEMKRDNLRKRWTSASPIQLTESLQGAEYHDARRRFARPTRYEMHGMNDLGGVLFFWDNEHLKNQFLYHQTRLSEDGALDERRKLDMTELGLRYWIDHAHLPAEYADYKIFLDAAQQYPEYKDEFLYRVWLGRQIHETGINYQTGHKALYQFLRIFDQFLDPPAQNKLRILENLIHISYIGAESLTVRGQQNAAGADLRAAALGISDGLTRAEAYIPSLFRIQPEADQRFFERGSAGVWFHELSHLLTGINVSLDYNFAHAINSGPLEGILHALMEINDDLHVNQEKRYLPLEQKRNIPTYLKLPASFFTPRIGFFGDEMKDEAALEFLEQLGIRYYVDDNGNLDREALGYTIKNKLIMEEGRVNFSKSRLSPQELGDIRALARLRGFIAFWAKLWNDSVSGELSSSWGSEQYPGKDLMEQMKPLGVEVMYPALDEIQQVQVTDYSMREKAQGVWNV